MSGAARSRGAREEYRALTTRERKVLELLLSVDQPGLVELRVQARFVEAARWNCGCASFDLKVDHERAPRSTVTAGAAVETTTREQADPNGTFDLLLWVDDGWLASVEIVDYVDHHGEESPDEIPPPGTSNEPRARSAT
jgi:hypothetical protein